MSSQAKATSAAPEIRTAEELEKMEYEPLLPVEIKLITYSLALGLILLVLLVWVSYTFFTVK